MQILKEHKCIMKKLEMKSSSIKDIGENICKNNITISNHFEEVKVNNINELWEVNVDPIKTFKAYLYGLMPLAYLCNAYEFHNDVKYLEKGKEILLSFVNYINSNNKIKYEFSISIGTVNIIHFFNLAEKVNILNEKELEDILDIIEYNKEFLTDNNNYIYGNHGLWQDIALLSITLIKDLKWCEEKIISIALERICRQINHNFTEEYINIENSMFYHIYNLMLFEEISEFVEKNFLLSSCQLEDFNKIKILSYEGRKAYNNFIRQDLCLPYIGDTENCKEKQYKYINKSVVYPKTGIALLKGDEYYYTIKSGVQGIGHKHKDDLSFTAYYKGEDIFIDAGKYTFQKDPFTAAIKSVFGHNLVYVNDKHYTIKTKNSTHLSEDEIDKAGMLEYRINESLEYIEVYNNFYKGVSLVRNFILLKPNIIILVDQCDGIRLNKYTQNFNIGQNFNIKSIDSTKDNITFIDKNNTIKVEIQQYFKTDGIEVNYGNDENYRGFSSERFNVLEKNYNIAFIAKSRKDFSYITSIEIYSEDKKEKKLMGMVYNKEELEIYYRENNISRKLLYNMNTKKTKDSEVKCDKITQFNNGIIIVEGKRVTIKINDNYDKYSSYIKYDEKLINKNYQKENVFCYECIESEKFIVKINAKNENESISEIIRI